MKFQLALRLGALAATLLAGCSGGVGTTGSMPNANPSQSYLRNGRIVPVWSQDATVIPLGARIGGPLPIIKRLAMKPDRTSKGGIYASEFNGTSILGYTNPNSNNNPPTCSVGPASYVQGIAVDGKGNLIDPDGGSRTVIVYQGPGMCGGEIGSVSDPYGQPSDAASANAPTRKIVVANIEDNNSEPGSVSVCTLSGGCTVNLTNSNIYLAAGVAEAKNGDCWVSAVNDDGDATLTYFAGCSGSGQTATGFENGYYGGLDIDEAGNLVSLDAFNARLYVYKGCNPTCSVVGGPFSLYGESVFGHLDKKSKHFIAADFEYGQEDVYSYAPTNLTYQYSFNNGLTVSGAPVESAAFNPRSKE
jgi:hypothetical protein